MKAYIGIIGHYIKDFKMQSVMLACRRFKGSHTAENILSMYQQVTDSFNLDGKITSIVTDNASNMTKAFQHPDCESDSEDEDLDISHSADFDYLPEHFPCFLHSLQLVVMDGLRDISSGISTIIGKASKLVTFVRHSCLATNILEDFRPGMKHDGTAPI